MLLDYVFFAPRRFPSDSTRLCSFLFLISLFFCPLKLYVVIVFASFTILDASSRCTGYLSVDVPQMRLDGHLDLPPHASHVPFNCY